MPDSETSDVKSLSMNEDINDITLGDIQIWKRWPLWVLILLATVKINQHYSFVLTKQSPVCLI